MTGIVESLGVERALSAWLAPCGDAMGRSLEFFLRLESIGGKGGGVDGEEAG